MHTITTHNLGFPRIGADRELKRALEAYWQGGLDEAGLQEVGRKLRQRHWQLQAQAGLDFVATGDFAWYDQVLTLSATVGNVPLRHRRQQPATDTDASAPPEPCRDVDLDTLFRMARGRAPSGPASTASEMTKWFDTNYHYLVPEFHPGQDFALSYRQIIDETKEAAALGYNPKPVILGPLSYLWLGKPAEAEFDRLELLDKLLPAYQALLETLADAGAQWVQIDEPILVLDLPDVWQRAFEGAYHHLQNRRLNVLLATYFGGLEDNLGTALHLPVAGIHIDTALAPEQLTPVLDRLPAHKVLSVGAVNGRNVWRQDLRRTWTELNEAHERLGNRLWLAPSCSLLHVPVDLERETDLSPEIKPLLAFATQKLAEVVSVAQLLDGRADPETDQALAESDRAQAHRRESKHIHRPEVQTRLAAVKPADSDRRRPFVERIKRQQEVLRLPLFPTTTIGSFPQTDAIREIRRDYKAGHCSAEQYQQRIGDAIADAVARQEALGLDVLVHGEAERNDMVEYFGEQLEGFAFTRFGWVQSYGSRCVKPPIIYGDVVRPHALTVDWWRFAQDLTDRPVKGMLTGPITMLGWSFVRDDQPLEATARQLALALRDEVLDLESAGARVIQIDEPALRERLPLRQAGRAYYLNWAVEAFKLSASGVRDDTQIHTHMCYSEFNDIIEATAALDADVITIETSRSHGELLQAFEAFHYPNDIGPGVYDIHSPNVPEVSDMVDLLERAARDLPVERLWVNPDCGLKTRDWPETEEALHRMVKAARIMREKYGQRSIDRHVADQPGVTAGASTVA